MALQAQSYSFGSTTIAANTINEDLSTVEVRHGYAFVCRYIVQDVAPTDAAWNLNLIGKKRQESIFAQPIRSSLIIGDGQDQRWFHPGFLFLPGERITLKGGETSGSDNTVFPTLIGYEFPADELGRPALEEDKPIAWDFSRQHVSYSTTGLNDAAFTVAANNRDDSQVVQLRSRNFHLKSAVFAAADNDLAFNLYSKARGEFLWHHGIRLTGINGTAEKPLIIEPEWELPAEDEVIFYFEDYSGSGNATRCVLNGTEELE